MYTFELPEIGEGVLEGEVVKWLVAEGDVVTQDQPVCEVMTDKANVEISIRDGGQVMKLHAEEGDVVKIHSPLMDIDKSAAGKASTPAAKATPPAPKMAAPAAKPDAPAPKPAPTVAAPVRATPATPSSPTNRTKTLATPAVRRTAREMGLDLKAVPGSGKDGRVTKDDVLRYAAGGIAGAATAPAAIPQSKAIPSGQEERIKIIGLRRKIAEQMVKSYRTAPHFTYVDEIDMTDLVIIRRSLKAAATARGVHLTYLPFIMKALCKAFQEFPNFNANVEEDPLTLIVKGDVNIGIAVDAPQGLFVPVIKNVEQKNILQIAAEVADLTARTRAGRVQLEELQGGTFTITSVGNIGGMFATPIINHPEVAILGVNKIHQRPVVRNGEIVFRDMLYLSPSFDHRCVDGAVAARFVSALKHQLENPGELLMELS
jgi:pyruvate dehydrogenase E2 component (dihydrolipoamide acetyltransferase)